MAPYPYGMSCATCPRWTSLPASVDDPLAVDAARAVLARARDEIRAGADRATSATAREELGAPGGRGCGAC